MSRQGLIVSGAVILGIGVLVTFGTYSSAHDGGGHYIVAYGAMAAGLFRIVRGLATNDDPRPERGLLSRDARAPLPDDARPLPLIGGAACAECGETIQSRLDGTACPTCSAPLHHDCKAAHRDSAHASTAA